MRREVVMSSRPFPDFRGALATRSRDLGTGSGRVTGSGLAGLGRIRRAIRERESGGHFRTV